jgi:hypothetical protein
MLAAGELRGEAKMEAGESELDMVLRHIRAAQEHIDRQREIIAAMEAKGQPTGGARALLDSFETTMALHREHLARVQAG